MGESEGLAVVCFRFGPPFSSIEVGADVRTGTAAAQDGVTPQLI
jgi:hypothetical protein